ncbi:MAG: NUDIX hydrolase [Endomicrobia bacterium]|nr:NUDIX hydrolase [Endomicrobiia bacterium]
MASTNIQKIKHEFSAGGVVVDNNQNVLIIKTKNLKNETVFTFPKGHIEKNETAQEAALREVEEETGVKARIVKELTDVEYWFIRSGEKIHKKVKWFLMQPIEKNSVKTKHEIEEVLWYRLDKAKDILSYDSDKKLVEQVLKIVSS